VLEFVSAHGGQVEIVDGEWSGAHFRIRMPLRSSSTPMADIGAPQSSRRAHAA
jgi:signal transduction histidine kinase